ncbi:MAG: hypothetical protein M3R17_21500 [Bacteroidota bacterium]|nr:hypothetical protein [Bacteroidota bacterium]
MQREEIIKRIFTFLDKIGIEKKEAKISGPVFMPGITIENGKLVVDIEELKYPGDMLHEAGHIAVTAKEERCIMSGAISKDKSGEEIATLLWSYMAALEAGIPPEIVFHPDGYKGDSDWLLSNFNNKTYIGLPLLEWMKIFEKKKDGTIKVLNWLRN